AYAVNTTGVSYGNQITFTTPVPTPPSLTTTTLSSITSVSVATGGSVVNNGGAPITARGVVWDTLQNPVVTKNKSINGSINNIFLDTIRGLAGSRVYYVRSYATNSAGTGYGNEVSFTTLTPVVPTVTINPIDLITNVSARSGGAITSDGGAAILSKGIVWSTFPNPTISNSKTTDGSGLASFTSQMTGLLGDSVYYVRAYATNATGTGYSSQLNFTAAPAVLATVITKPVTAITSTSATSGGTISLTGGAPHSEKGVVYGTATNPTILNTKLIDNTVGLDWVSNITGLTGNTKYYVRAYATNVIGTSYGVLDSFTTGPILPIITTNPVATITSTTAISGGNISSNGGSAITARGIVWNKTGNPAVGTDSIRTDASTTTGSYTLNLGNLNAGITYYVRAYATNAVGIAYGNQLTFTTQPVLDTIGNQYTTITINGKEWFKENLKTTKYANGDSIENVPTAGDWGLRTSGAWAYYNNDLNNDSSLGKLYNWYAVTDVKGLCPTGWHVATDADWTSLTANYGTDANAGNELKATTLWTAPNSNTNSSNFGALPGGGRGGLNFGDLNNKGFWWTSTLFDASNSYARRLEYNTDTVIRYTESNKYGFSVRCVKN
ncbi:MAG: FISUMP domain-containing protein, partial [Bacteroidota bacterium]